MNKRRGFTLLELLIVIAIIGILITAGIVSYSSAQKKARDSRRRADLKAIQNAFEQSYAESATQEYPDACGAITSDYLPGGLPTDPLGTSYAVSCATDEYCFCATLESGTPNSDGSCNFLAGTKTSYCVKNLQ